METGVVGPGNRNSLLLEQIDPFVHTLQKFPAVDGAGKQQRCVQCIADGVKRPKYTSYYCGLCTVTASRNCERRPSKHAYCIASDRQCFSRHIAACYQHITNTGRVAQRAHATTQEAGEVCIAGPVILDGPPSTRKRKRSRR